ncbi:hypothetical protein SAMN04487950_3805 [Halogranum rubrum]|uniref:Uncharacterized protein n=1 Tax=Halogranum rubrum TaxID=553466 RepID=A0A1I4HTD1_9EURY|nr:hypothetical protein SAMN04487950_3805 [Halogranum rubrum]
MWPVVFYFSLIIQLVRPRSMWEEIRVAQQARLDWCMVFD